MPAAVDFLTFCRQRAQQAGWVLVREQEAAIKLMGDSLPPPAGKTGLAGFFTRRPPLPPGFFLCGRPGGGKTWLLDCFHAFVAGRKQRVHFIDFMESVHGKIRAHRQSSAKGDPVPKVAADIAASSPILCCDEFQVEDIADAAILSRFFARFWQAGGLLAATGNIRPDQLYAGGLQRRRFLPFLDSLTQHCRVIDLAPGRDFRQALLQEAGFYHYGADAEAKLNALFAKLTADCPASPSQLTLAGGRQLAITRSAAGIAWLGFEDVCGKPFGAQDYVALAGRFKMIFLHALPRLQPEDRNVAKRFMLLVDVLYDRHIDLVISAASRPEEIYPHGTGAEKFARTVSRLAEMGRGKGHSSAARQHDNFA